MGEIKSVKVDNWGVFFLQKLQNFFNKTDYCDLTLQFRDNSQLKVHRLVLSACTDYFNVLEQTCEVIDDALLMPDELQADVVVPIVNFMYTGTLEFELKMYGKLLRTAKEMNMTVLLKLLEAHRRTMEGVNRAQRPPSPKTMRRRPIIAGAVTIAPTQPTQQRRILTSANAASLQGRGVAVQTKNIATNAPQQSMQFRQQIGSTSLLRTSPGNTGAIRTQYGTTTIYSTQQAKPEDSSNSKQQQPTSPFEQLRKGYNNNKRPAPTTFGSPPAKKPNIEDVKEFAEQQRMRKQIAAEYNDDPDYEPMLDDDIHNADDDDDDQLASGSTGGHTLASTSKQQQQSDVDQPGTTTITFKQEPNDRPPTIVVKDSSNSKMNHAKIISEVLRQYPHLVKGNKNIKLKIMPNPGGQTQKIIVRKEPLDETEQSSTSPSPIKLPVSSQTLLRSSDRGGGAPRPQQQLTSKQQPGFVQKQSGTTAAENVPTAGVSQKRRIDSKTMHTLIALGAENTTGPWLCLRCGVNGRPISIPSYRGFRRHLINTHKEAIDSALCEHCGWRSENNRALHFHMHVEHKIRTTLYTFPQCLMCAALFVDTNALNHHMMDSHADENKQQCIYCNKIFAKEGQLYTHMKTFHKKQALDDGIIDDSEEETTAGAHDPDGNKLMDKKDGKVKIISDISLPIPGSLLKLEPSSEAAALSTVASGIATSIAISSAEEFMQSGDEPKFVNADGNEMLLTEEQRKEIMSQLNDGGAGVVMVLNESTFDSTTIGNVEADDTAADVTMGSEDGEPTEDANMTGGEEEGVSDEECDDSQIYNELTSPESKSAVAASKVAETKKAAVNESKESADDSLEWAENLISAHEMADEASGNAKPPASETLAKKAEDISKKLKELTGDWSDDEIEGDDEEDAEAELDTEEDEKSVTNREQKQVAEEAKSADAAEKRAAIPDAPEITEAAEMETEEEEEEEETIAEVKPPEIEEPSLDEDDIDLAMKSLHKDDDVGVQREKTPELRGKMTAEMEKPKTGIKTAEQEEEDEEVEAVPSQQERMDVAEEEDEDEEENVEKAEVKIEVEEKFKIKDEIVSPISLKLRSADSEVDKEKYDSKSLLAELIAEADIFKDDEDEFISEKEDKQEDDVKKSVRPNAKSPTPEPKAAIAVEKKTTAEAQRTPTPTIDVTVTEEQEDAVTVTKSDMSTALVQDAIDAAIVADVDEDAIANKMVAVGAAAPSDANMSSNNSNDETASTTAPKATSSAASAATEASAKETTTSTVALSSKTADKMKSLISEWGEDDEEDDADEL